MVLRVLGHGPVGQHVTCRGTATDRSGAYFHLLAGSMVWPSIWVSARIRLSASWTGAQTVGSSDPTCDGSPRAQRLGLPDSLFLCPAPGRAQ